MASSSQLIRVFVYGTLKRGQPNHYLMTDVNNGVARFIANAKTTAKYPLVIATRYNIPFLLDKSGVGEKLANLTRFTISQSLLLGNFIEGEIYEVDTKMLGVLDKLEDYPNWYDRQEHDMETPESKISCWVYLLKDFPARLLQLEHITCYKNNPEKPYLERSERLSIIARDDLEYGID